MLVVEDDRSLLSILEYNLLYSGYNVLTARDGSHGLELARSKRVDLIILDLGLPAIDGMDVCTALRVDGNTVPILILTARGGAEPCIEGLERGADDYVTKPFQVSELMARVASHLRRSDMSSLQADGNVRSERGNTLTVGNLHVDFIKRRATKGDKPISLRPREFEILGILASSRGQVVTRKQICTDLSGEEQVDNLKLVDVHISMLRGKIEEDRKNPTKIVTVHGRGYRLNP